MDFNSIVFTFRATFRGTLRRTGFWLAPALAGFTRIDTFEEKIVIALIVCTLQLFYDVLKDSVHMSFCDETVNPYVNKMELLRTFFEVKLIQQFFSVKYQSIYLCQFGYLQDRFH